MTIPFIDLFKKLSERFSAMRSGPSTTTEPEPPPAARPRVTRVHKTSHPSFSKTVLPNRTRSSTAPDPFRAAAAVTPTAANPSMQLTPGKIVHGPTAATPRSRELPRALALALEPKLERAVSLKISDFIDQVPAGFIKPVEILDVNALISLKASEIEKGMAEGKPSVSLTSLYQQLPEIFLRSVPVDDETRVALPFDKVYAQFKSARVREDQEIDPDIPQVDTPILQVTLEETKRFGTKLEPLKTSLLPRVPVEPATAETLAKAEPEAVETSKPSAAKSFQHPVISLQGLNLSPKPGETKPAIPVPGEESKLGDAPESLKPSPQQTKPTIEIPSKFPIKPPAEASESGESPKPETEVSSQKPKIPFQFPPNGTGAPASERVPASAGPPVPINLSASPPSVSLKSPPPIADKPVSPTPVPLKGPATEIPAEPAVATSRTAEAGAPGEKPAPTQLKLSMAEFATKPVVSKSPVPEAISLPEKPVLSQLKLPMADIATKPAVAKSPVPEAISSAEKPVASQLKLPMAEFVVARSPIVEPAPAAEKPATSPIKLSTLNVPTQPVVAKGPSTESAPAAAPVSSPIKLPATEIPIQSTAVKTAPPPVAEKSVAASNSSKISLPLKTVLKFLPAFQLAGDVESVPESAQIEFPLSLIEPQLARGRIAISPEEFRVAIPEPFRNLFQPDVASSLVLLPLQEVLKNLPDGFLSIRTDQERTEDEKEIETPFSIRAKEDATRFGVLKTAGAVSSTKSAEKTEVKQVEQVEAEKQDEFDEDLVPEIDVKEVMSRTGALSGVKACAVMFSDGLNLAGTLPPQMRVDGLCAMAPSLFQKVDKHMRETRLGNLVAVTMHSGTQAISFFARRNICLAILHSEAPLTAATREEIACLVEKLSRTYTHPEISHVDH